MPRQKSNTNRVNRIDISELQRYVAITMGFLLVVFVVAQFIVLDLAGIHGPEITKLRNQEDSLKLEIELKRAQVSDMSKSNDIKVFASDNLGYKPTSVNIIQVAAQNTDNGNAQNSTNAVTALGR